MRVVTPDYYHKFHCIADECQHTCCAGWEIDIDAQTLRRYKKEKTPFGERLRKHISEGSFVLDEKERCPFLNEKNLCDIILTMGKDALCQVCRDHPRFRNFYKDVTEEGLGLCCEAAAELILKNAEKVSFPAIEPQEVSPAEWETMAYRAKVIDILQDRSKPVTDRFASLPTSHISGDRWKKIFLSLERLDDAWTEKLQQMEVTAPRFSLFERETEQLAVYLLWRHLAGEMDAPSLFARTAFARLCCQTVAAMSQTTAQFLENARLLSAEIEYSEQNLSEIFSILEAEYGGF